MDEIPAAEVAAFEKSLLRYFHDAYKDVCEEIEKKGSFSDECIAKTEEGMKKALEQFKLVKGVN
jgi:F0F1-type ATP synthase alpha subunit